MIYGLAILAALVCYFLVLLWKRSLDERQQPGRLPYFRDVHPGEPCKFDSDVMTVQMHKDVLIYCRCGQSRYFDRVERGEL